MSMQHWLVKQEPETYSWDNLVSEGQTAWTGVRNFQARANLQKMQKGDPVLFYHSGKEKAVVGLAAVEREAYPDPTADEAGWVCVDLVPVRPLEHPVPLAAIKAAPELSGMALVRQSRLSVSPMTEQQFRQILAMART